MMILDYPWMSYQLETTGIVSNIQYVSQTKQSLVTYVKQWGI